MSTQTGNIEAFLEKVQSVGEGECITVRTIYLDARLDDNLQTPTDLEEARASLKPLFFGITDQAVYRKGGKWGVVAGFVYDSANVREGDIEGWEAVERDPSQRQGNNNFNGLPQSFLRAIPSGTDPATYEEARLYCVDVVKISAL